MAGLTVNSRLNLREVLPLPGRNSIARADPDHYAHDHDRLFEAQKKTPAGLAAGVRVATRATSDHRDQKLWVNFRPMVRGRAGIP